MEVEVVTRFETKVLNLFPSGQLHNRLHCYIVTIVQR